MPTTILQQTPLKALSELVLLRNRQRNNYATPPEKRRNFLSNSIPKKLLVEIPAAAAEIESLDWRQKPKAWLTAAGELRTTGVFDDLTGEIIKLTADNLFLQKHLLRLHCGKYSGPHWKHIVTSWREQTITMNQDMSIPLEQAALIAATQLSLLAFWDELQALL